MPEAKPWRGSAGSGCFRGLLMALKLQEVSESRCMKFVHDMLRQSSQSCQTTEFEVLLLLSHGSTASKQITQLAGTALKAQRQQQQQQNNSFDDGFVVNIV